VRHFIQESVWLLPGVGLVIGWGVANPLNWVERRMGWQSGIDPEAARALFGMLAGVMFTFIVFMASTLLLILQLASAQLTPRIVGFAFRSRVIRLVLTLFAFTLSFTLVILVRIKDSVPTLTSHLASYLCLLSIGVFLFLVDHVGRTLRPSGVLVAVGRLGHKVIRSMYPHLLPSGQIPATTPTKAPEGEPDIVIPSSTDGVILEFDPEGLIAEARRIGSVVELVPQVGDFVAAGSPLFRIYGGNVKPSASALHESVALGPERTMEQDPAFVFRIIVDIASKALSPAINDPTTAVLAVDQIHHLLRSVGRRCLDPGIRNDPAGAVRLIYPTRNWENFVRLAVTEIRQFGGGSIQVVRRLRSMLENLNEVLPPDRTGLLREELSLLERAAGRMFPEPEDRVLANTSDSQGVGGKPGKTEAEATDSAKEQPH
jgi:uncharacterized membrane protein